MQPDESHTSLAPATPGGIAAGEDDKILHILSEFDDVLIDALEKEDIRILSAEWIRRQADDYVLQKRQDLEAKGGEGPFLSSTDAVELVRKQGRKLGVLSYGWLTPSLPDPEAKRLKALRTALASPLCSHIEGFFWDFASLPQAERSEAEQKKFERALNMMGDLYASAVGTTVLRSAFIPVATADREYNDRPYEQRGWCFFESTVSTELVFRLNDKVRQAISTLPPKVLELHADGSVTEPCAGMRESFSSEVKKRTFTGKGDAEKVAKLYDKYVERIAERLEQTLHITTSPAHGAWAELPLPEVILPEASPAVHLEPGEWVLFRTCVANGAQWGLPPVVRAPQLRRTPSGAVQRAQEAAPQSIDALDHRALPWKVPGAVGGLVAPASEPYMQWLVSSLAVAEEALSALATRSVVSGSQEPHSFGSPNERTTAPRERSLLPQIPKRDGVTREEAEAMSAVAQAATLLLSMPKDTLTDAADKKKVEQTMAEVARLLRAANAHAMYAGDIASLVDGWEQLVETIGSTLHLSGCTRRFAKGQQLVARLEGRWAEVTVVGHDSGRHQLRLEGTCGRETSCSLQLGPWNHSPLEMRLEPFDSVRDWWLRTLKETHSSVTDALSGHKLSVMEQCVPMKMALVSSYGNESSALTSAGSKKAADGEEGAQASVSESSKSLLTWLVRGYERLVAEGDEEEAGPTPPRVLITADAAAGKTTLSSQLIMLLADTEMVPILVKGQLWQRWLTKRDAHFRAAWNWVDAYVQVQFEGKPAVQRMLRQAMLSRRAVLILDGLDECGDSRRLFERHIASVLVPQGHMIVATSRPGSVDKGRFRTFQVAKLMPLTVEQQQHVLASRLGARLGAAEVERVWRYIGERMAHDAEGRFITSNPLMLSMVASIAELRVGHDMPRSLASLYKVATNAMLERARASALSVEELHALVRRLFFHAHMRQQRVIDEGFVGDVVRATHPERATPIGPATITERLLALLRQDGLPLLSVLLSEPLQVQAVHLSFQEYYAARAIAEGQRLPEGFDMTDEFWGNMLRLGGGLGRQFVEAVAGDGDGRAELMVLACERGYEECVRELMEVGRGWASRGGIYSTPALCAAAEGGHLVILNMLLGQIRARRDTSVVPANTSKSPSSGEGSPTMGRSLVERRGGGALRDEGRGLLQCRSVLFKGRGAPAASTGKERSPAREDADGALEVADEFGWTALMRASAGGHESCVRALIAAGPVWRRRPSVARLRSCAHRIVATSRACAR